MLINLIVVISQYIHILNHHIVHLKKNHIGQPEYIHFLSVSYTSLKLGGNKNKILK